jgi:uncharacterized repeat protein (TIGR01451 family)
MGRWPNLDNGDGGYTTVSAQPAGNHLTSSTALPAGNWVGGTIHLKVIRWSMVNRNITAVSGSTLTLNEAVSCLYTSNCTGWGFFINNSLSTLDREGEWYYNKGTRQLYLYTTTNPSSSTIEGSVVLKTDDRNWGAINLGDDYDLQVHDVVIDNFDIRGWFRSGIVSPTNLHPDENSYLTIRNNTIKDVDDSGINLWTWVWGASDGLDGWRGGNNILIQNNLIDGANSFGIHTPSRVTTIEGNTIRNIGLIANLNEAGMGCGKDGWEGSCTEDGAGLRIYVDNPVRSGYGFTVRYNRFENVAYNGIQTFGHSSTFANNFFNRACISKGDGGAINTFGSNVHDIQITGNIITDTIGNTDGTHPDFRAQFGFGLYIDEHSANVNSSGNTVARSTGHGILYQNSTGSIQNNTLFDNAYVAALWADQTDVTGNSSVPNHTGNILLSKINNAGTLAAGNAGLLGTSDYNGFYHANRSNHIRVGGEYTLPAWKSTSGKDVHSTGFVSVTLAQAELFYNETRSPRTFPLNKWYIDLARNLVNCTVTVPAYASQILLPAQSPLLSIQANAPLAHAGDPMTITLLVRNTGSVAASDLLITNTLPLGASYLSGGARMGDVLSWTVSSLAAGNSVAVNFVITTTATAINQDYGVSANGCLYAVGNWFAIIPDPQQIFLPLVRR